MDTNTECIANIQKHTQEAVVEIRECVENEKNKNIAEFLRVENKIT